MQELVSIRQYIEEQVNKTPERTALIYQNQSLTYQEVNHRANQLAHYLRNKGVKEEVIVGICLERSLEMVIGLLGILKAGAAYVALDPTYPEERIRFTLEDANVNLILTQQSTRKVLPEKENYQLIDLIADSDKISQETTENPLNITLSNHLAYLIYTSGSTGKPKGVCIEHANTIAFINWAKTFFTPEQLSGVLASTSLCFDLSIFEIFVTLSYGGKVILAKNALELANLPAANQVTLINTVPSAIATLLKIKAIPSSVKTINLAGEALSNNLAQELYQLEHISEVFNLYGPSEDTTYSTVALIPKGFEGIPPIGKPISETVIYILDEQLNEVTEGEIYISSSGLARGYLNRPELVQERFIPNPYQPGTRMYKTGDLGTYLPDGDIKYLGRIDQQVKIRGFRIELAGIETILAEHPQVDKAVVLPQEQKLVAYVTSSSTVIENWADFLGEKLPDYMIPVTLIILKEFPLTLNGKIDRRALPIPNFEQHTETTYEAPQSDLEKMIAEVWKDLLGISQVSMNDTFWSLGGDSLLVVQMLQKIKEVLGIEVPLDKFLKSPTLDGLKSISQGKVDTASTPKLEQEAILDADIYPQGPAREENQHIFLTGGSGFLGAFLLYEILEQTESQIYCLIRAEDSQAGFEKLRSNISSYNPWRDEWTSRLVVVLGDLSEARLGIDSELYTHLTEKIDLIYHCGAWVNIVYPYSMLKNANVIGTQEVLRLACLHHAKPVHFISTIDVFADDSIVKINLEENISLDLLSNGYAQSKYVAETLMVIAQSRGLPITIYRPSNIIGIGSMGIYDSHNFSFIPRIIQACLELELAPDIDAQTNLVPVDYVASLIFDLSQQHKSGGRFFNMVNPRSITWHEIVQSFQRYGYSLEMVSHQEWFDKLEQKTDSALASIVSFVNNPDFVRHSIGALEYKLNRKKETNSDRPKNPEDFCTILNVVAAGRYSVESGKICYTK